MRPSDELAVRKLDVKVINNIISWSPKRWPYLRNGLIWWKKMILCTRIEKKFLLKREKSLEKREIFLKMTSRGVFVAFCLILGTILVFLDWPFFLFCLFFSFFYAYVRTFTFDRIRSCRLWIFLFIIIVRRAWGLCSFAIRPLDRLG